MAYTLTVNRIEYLVSDHAAERMMLREITDEMIIMTIENGDMIEQKNGRYRFEYDIESGRIIIVVADLDLLPREIVTVFDAAE
jgi:hypothetical protein